MLYFTTMKIDLLVVPQHKSILARRLPFQVAQAHTVPGANQVETKNMSKLQLQLHHFVGKV